MKYPEEEDAMLLNLRQDVVIKQEFHEDEGSFVLHVQPLRLCSDVLITAVQAA